MKDKEKISYRIFKNLKNNYERNCHSKIKDKIQDNQ